ncbi:MAG: arginyltransferase, partial [Gammaproteobacteria bacterium]
EHACSYLEGKQASTLFADPDYPMTRQVYSRLAIRGFRRSGDYLYQPHCGACNACVPVRIPVKEFIWRRTYMRTWKRNQDLTVRTCKAMYNDQHQELYRRYVNHRHKDGGMDNPRAGTYLSFLSSTWMDTTFYEMRLANKLLAVAVVDHLDHGLSAVYTFYDPDETRRSLGTFSILYEINEARRRGLDWLYLGYWIKDCHKMNYKNDFKPLEYYRNGGWRREL